MKNVSLSQIGPANYEIKRWSSLIGNGTTHQLNDLRQRIKAINDVKCSHAKLFDFAWSIINPNLAIMNVCSAMIKKKTLN